MSGILSYVPTGLEHGLDLSNPVVQTWLYGIPAAHILCVVLFRMLGLWPKPSQRPGSKVTGSRSSDMIAYNIVSGYLCCYVAYYGTIAQFGLFGNNELEKLNKAPGPSHNRFYNESEWTFEHLTMPMLGYQIYNFILCFLVKDLSDPAMIGHHFFTGTLAYMGLHPYLHVKSIFFFGFAEVSNVFLTIRDFFKYIPSLKTSYPKLYDLSSLSFGVSFIAIRLIMWPYISYDFWTDSISLLQSGKAHSTLVVATFLVANVFLTGLQFMWGKMIFKIILGKKSKKKKSQ